MSAAKRLRCYWAGNHCFLAEYLLWLFYFIRQVDSLSLIELDPIDVIIGKSSAVVMEPQEKTFADMLISQSLQNAIDTNTPLGLSLAASFDLYTAVEYYKRIANRGWLYCPRDEPLLIYPFTNVCPRCVLSGDFHYHQSNKPESGAIGTITRRLLCVFLKQFFERQGKSLHVRMAAEPVDVIIYDENEQTALLAEVKAAPLTTLPLAVHCEKMTDRTSEGSSIELPHTSSDNPSITRSLLHIVLPHSDGQGEPYELVSLGTPGTHDLKEWFYVQLERLFGEDDNLFRRYFQFWMRAYQAYNKSEREKNAALDAVYWYTNACGQPVPRPPHWPGRPNGTGYQSISDGKSSVGMDRTDDIKKGIYQVLKIATANKPKAEKWSVKTALISNIHAIRHYEEYLLDLQDVIWTLDTTGNAKTAGDLPAEAILYNLFDGIIAFTKNYSRDEWITQHFNF